MGRGPAGSRDRGRRGQGDPASQHAGRADDPLVGEPPWCGEGCDCCCGGRELARRLRDNPATLLDRQAAAGVKGNTTLAWEGNKAVLTFPLPHLTGATATATLDETFLTRAGRGQARVEHVRVDVRRLSGLQQRAAQDRSHLAGTIVESRNGKVVRDLRRRRPRSGRCTSRCRFRPVFGARSRKKITNMIGGPAGADLSERVRLMRKQQITGTPRGRLVPAARLQ